MNSDKNGRLQLSVTNVYGDFIKEPADIQLRHQTLSEQVVLRNVSADGPIVAAGLRSNPLGLYRAFIDAPSYLPSAFMVSIPNTGTLEKNVPLAVDYRKVTKVRFPDWPALLCGRELLERSKTVLGFPNQSGEALYTALDDVRRAGLLNILAKCRCTPVSGNKTVVDYLADVKEIRGDRFFVAVPQELREEVKNAALDEHFRAVPSTLHTPPSGFTHAGSWKTLDLYGNLQLTFFSDGANWLADIDIDDGAGLAHVFQVVRNSVEHRQTHPYDISQILIRSQEIDPGYRLLLDTATDARTSAAGSGKAV